MTPRDLRPLQAVVALLSGVPIVAGAAGVWLGPGLVQGGGGGDLDSHFRYLSGLLLGIGLGFLAMVPGLARRTAAFRMLAAIVAIGGLGRLLSLAEAGTPSTPHLAALVLELAVVPALAAWQGSVARRALSPPSPPPPASPETP